MCERATLISFDLPLLLRRAAAALPLFPLFARSALDLDCARNELPAEPILQLNLGTGTRWRRSFHPPEAVGKEEGEEAVCIRRLERCLDLSPSVSSALPTSVDRPLGWNVAAVGDFTAMFDHDGMRERRREGRRKLTNSIGGGTRSVGRSIGLSEKERKREAGFGLSLVSSAHVVRAPSITRTNFPPTMVPEWRGGRRSAWAMDDRWTSGFAFCRGRDWPRSKIARE